MIETMLDISGISSENIKRDFSKLPTLSGEHSIVSMGDKKWNFRLHSYISYFNNKFWCMWSHGRDKEDGREQHVRYSTSLSGIDWDDEKVLIGPSQDLSIRYIARGFFISEVGPKQYFVANVSSDTIGKYFGDNLELKHYAFVGKDTWGYLTSRTGYITNFPPKVNSLGLWYTTFRNSDRDIFFSGTREHLISNYKVEGVGVLDEPDWYELPSGVLCCLFRDNNKSGRLIRSFSSDKGLTWAKPTLTNFPNTMSKFNCIETNQRFYVIINNPYPGSTTLCLSTSVDGLVFNKMFRIEVPKVEVDPSKAREECQYPCILDHDGHLYISFSRRKQTVEVVKIKMEDIL